MLVSVPSRVNKAVAVFILWSIAALTVAPFAPAFGANRSTKISNAASQNQPPAHKPNEVLVRFRSTASENDKNVAATSQGARRAKKLRGESGIETLELTTGTDAVTAALQLNQNPAVEFAEPNFFVKGDQVAGINSNDPRFSEQWALSNVGQNGGQYGSDIDALKAWQQTQGTSNVVVAVIDSGVDFSHPDLAGNQWTNSSPTNGDIHGWDFVADDAGIRDEQGHGTAVAGIIAAQGNNGVGISGVMWHAGLMSLRVLDEAGNGDVANAVEAIDYAAAHGAHVINLSWGTEAFSIALKDAIDRALKRGVVVVCSAGNTGTSVDEGSSAYYPASFDSPDLIAVAGSTNYDQLASWSNFGASRVTVAAPGQNILTTQKGGAYW